MRYRQKTVLGVHQLGVFSVFLAAPLWACNASHVIGSGGSGAVYTMSANTMDEGGLYLGINSERVRNRALESSDITDAMERGAKHLHSIDAVHTDSLSLSYGITDVLTLNMNLPYTSRRGIRAGEWHDEGYGIEAKVHRHSNSDGLGDLSAILQYKVYDADKTKAAVLVGVKAPTGSTDVSEEDEVLEADLQPGSGSWDYFAGFALTYVFEYFSVHTSTLYKYNTEGVEESRLGNIFTYNGAISFHLSGENHTHIGEADSAHHERFYSIDFFAEINGEVAQSDRFHGEKADNTGHHIIYLTAGLQFLTEGAYSAFAAFSAPAYQKLEGMQNEIRYKASIGVGKSF